tara:strand:+ start:220 stop:609 length:390 start_codon:yes stop_codon:yes gene_type:complete
MSSDIYRENILEYYRNPRNHGSIPDADITLRDTNPLCGDDIEISIKIIGNKIDEIKFKGKGCAISQSSVSMLTEKLKGKDIESARNIDKEYILKMLGIEINASRLKCAMLGLKVIKLGIYNYLGKKLNQ